MKLFHEIPLFWGEYYLLLIVKSQQLFRPYLGPTAGKFKGRHLIPCKGIFKDRPEQSRISDSEWVLWLLHALFLRYWKSHNFTQNPANWQILQISKALLIMIWGLIFFWRKSALKNGLHCSCSAAASSFLSKVLLWIHHCWCPFPLKNLQRKMQYPAVS